MTAPRPATYDETLEVLCRAPQVHPYGIADVVQLWDRSTWWTDTTEGDAVVGLMDLPGSPEPVLYAVAAVDAVATLHLVERLAEMLPTLFVATGPPGFTSLLALRFHSEDAARFSKFHLAEPRRLGPPDPRAATVRRDHLPALAQLFATDPSAGDFFHPGLLDGGWYVGIWEEASLVAVAGVHVVEPGHRVAALGNVVTHPRHRRTGLGRAVVAALCHRLRTSIDVIGLNVRVDNAAARGLYRGLGFVSTVDFEQGTFAARTATDHHVRSKTPGCGGAPPPTR